MSKDGTHDILHELIHPSQLEQKFGGEAENLTEFWPPRHISDEFGHDPDLIVEQELDDNENDTSEISCKFLFTIVYQVFELQKLFSTLVLLIFKNYWFGIGHVNSQLHELNHLNDDHENQGTKGASPEDIKVQGKLLIQLQDQSSIILEYSEKL